MTLTCGQCGTELGTASKAQTKQVLCASCAGDRKEPSPEPSFEERLLAVEERLTNLEGK